MKRSRSRERVPVVAGAAAVMLLIVGCGAAQPRGSTPLTSSTAPSAAIESSGSVMTPVTQSPPSVPDLPPGLLATPSNGVAFLQWTQAGTTLTGSLTQVWTTLGSAAPQHQVVDFTGVLGGSSVTLTLAGGESINGTAFLTGHLQAGQLTLTLPAPDGTIATLVFVPATVADYNRAVAQFESALATQAAPPPTAAAAFECGLQVLGHDAFVGVNGPLGSWAWNGCLHIAAVVALPGANWGPVDTSVAAAPAGDGVTCGGILRNVYDDHVIIFDSGGQYFGGLICNALPLTIAYLGVIVQAVPGGLELESGQGTNGTMIPAVAPGSPAARAGLEQGDIITALDGVTLASGGDLTTVLAYDSPGQSVQLTYLRTAQLATVTVVLGSR